MPKPKDKPEKLTKKQRFSQEKVRHDIPDLEMDFQALPKKDFEKFSKN